MSQTTDHHDSALTMSSDVTFAPTLPQTVAQRRNARLRAAALQAIPLLLFLFAAALRLWEPDFVPFGARQAEYVAIADSRSPLQVVALYLDVSRSPLTLVWPLLRELPQSVVLWVILRGLLDSLGVALLFLAARPLVGVWGATLAALLYAVNPWVWAAARDPAGPLTPLLVAASLYGAVRLVARPTMLNGAVLGVLLGLLARSVSPGLIVVLLGASALAVARASWKVGGATALALVLVGGPLILTVGLPVTSVWTVRPDLTLSTRLVEALTYQLPDARAAGSLSAALSAPAVVALGLLAWVTGSVVAGWLAWRGQRAIILPSLWGLAAGSGVLAMHAWRWSSGGGAPIPTSMQAAEANSVLLFWPILFVVVCTAAGARIRAVCWGGTAVAGLALAASVGALGGDMRGIQTVSAQEPLLGHATAAPAEGGQAGSSGEQEAGRIGQRAHLRDWMALAQAVREAAARIDADEVVVPGGTLDRIHAEPLQTLLGARLRVRQLSAATTLPLQRETLFAVPASAALPRELARPASAVSVVRADGVDTGARLLTLRPRPAEDWLIQTRAVADGAFANGAKILALSVAAASNGQTDILLYLDLPPPSDARSDGPLVLFPILRDARHEIVGAFPPGALLRPRAGELSVVRVRLQDASQTAVQPPGLAPGLVVWLVASPGTRVRTATGEDELVIPLTGLP